MNKYIITLYNSLLVGLISAVFFIISGWLGATTWVVFFAWANYFLHESNIKKSLKLILALSIGIIIAFLASHLMDYINNTFIEKLNNEKTKLYINGGVIFIVATSLVFLESIEGWGQFVPATFLGTVLFFASGLKVPGTSLHIILINLIIPLSLGIIAGYFTITGRKKLNHYIEKNTKNKISKL